MPAPLNIIHLPAPLNIFMHYLFLWYFSSACLSVRLSVGQFVCQHVCLFFRPSSVCLSPSLCCLSISQLAVRLSSIRLSLCCLSISQLAVRLSSVCLSLCCLSISQLAVRLSSVCLSLCCPSIVRWPIYLFIRPSIHVPDHLSLRPSIWSARPSVHPTAHPSVQ